MTEEEILKAAEDYAVRLTKEDGIDRQRRKAAFVSGTKSRQEEVDELFTLVDDYRKNARDVDSEINELVDVLQRVYFDAVTNSACILPSTAGRIREILKRYER